MPWSRSLPLDTWQSSHPQRSSPRSPPANLRVNRPHRRLTYAFHPPRTAHPNVRPWHTRTGFSKRRRSGSFLSPIVRTIRRLTNGIDTCVETVRLFDRGHVEPQQGTRCKTRSPFSYEIRRSVPMHPFSIPRWIPMPPWTRRSEPIQNPFGTFVRRSVLRYHANATRRTRFVASERKECTLREPISYLSRPCLLDDISPRRARRLISTASPKNNFDGVSRRFGTARNDASVPSISFVRTDGRFVDRSMTSRDERRLLIPYLFMRCVSQAYDASHTIRT